MLLEIAAATSYIFVLIGVNLIGYGIGVSGLAAVVDKFGTSGRENKGETGVPTVLAGAFFFLAIGVCIMRFLQRIGVSGSARTV